MRSSSLVLTAVLLVVLAGGSSAFGAEGSTGEDPGGRVNDLISRLVAVASSTASPKPKTQATSEPDADAGRQSQAQSAESGGDVQSAVGTPVMADDEYAISQNAGRTTLTPAIGSNDTLPGPADQYTVHIAGGTPSHGEVAADGTTYRPDTGYAGTDTFQYWYTYPTDSGATAAGPSATVTLTVVPEGQQVAIDDTYTVEQNSTQNSFTVQSNDSNPAAANLETPSDPPHGTVTKKEGPNQAYLYTPDPGFYGSDSFTYRYHYLADTAQQSNTATVTIRVVPDGATGDEPVAFDDSYTIAKDSGATTLDPSIKANDIEPSGSHFVHIKTGPAHGTVSEGGTTYTPDPGFSGMDSFTYVYRYSSGSDLALHSSNVATVSITVGPANSFGGGDDLLAITDTCSGEITFTNTSDLGLEVVYGDLPSHVDGDFVLAPEDSETITTDRKTLEYRADGPGDEFEEGTIRIRCSGHDHDGDSDGDSDDDGDGHHRHHGKLPDTGGPALITVLWAMASIAAGVVLLGHGRRMGRRQA